MSLNPTSSPVAADASAFSSHDVEPRREPSATVAPSAASFDVAADVFGNVDRDTNRLSAEYVRSQRSNIAAASQASGVSPWAIGAVLFQEARNYNSFDADFDNKARAWLDAPPGSAQATGAAIDLQDAAIGLAQDSTIESVSFGPAQVQLQNVKALINEGYLARPPGYDADPTRAALALSLSPQQAPYVAAAHLQRVSDDWIRRGGTPAIRTDPEAQYKLLTQLYSQYSPGKTRPNPSPDLRSEKINASGQEAVANFSVIRKALFTDSPIYGFDGKKLPESQRFNPQDPLEGLPGR
jgi:hypothetical protein